MPTDDDVIWTADSFFIPGDSGGPGFNEKNELCMVISGGYFWWGEVETNNGGKLSITYPGRAYGLRPIRKLLNSILPNKFEAFN
jgi:hypothetical protein